MPLRIRLVCGFVAAMFVVLSAAGAFVYWRVEVALDRTLNSDLGSQSAELRRALTEHPPPVEALAALPTQAVRDQIVDRSGRVVASTPGAGQRVLLPASRLRSAERAPVRYRVGGLLLLDRRQRLRVLAFPVTGPGAEPLVAVTAVRLGQRDEALRELLAQLVSANLAALLAASLVGYRLAQRALAPVERYRARAQEITSGATGVRLDVPAHVDDEITRLGHTLNDMLAAQEHAANAQRQFLADASHELRTPLTVLTAEVELALRRSRPTEELEATLRNVAQDAGRLVRLADQLLDLEQAQLVGTHETDVDVAVDGAAARARVQLGGDGREITTSRAPGLIVSVSATQLDQVLGNLADNAVSYGAGPIRLAAGSVGRAGQPVVRIEVSDQGRGMPPAFIPHAIGRFRRADAARTTPGSGLGLAVVHTIVAAAGGEFRLCTASGHHSFAPARFADVPCAMHDGTTATVLLPARSREEPGRGRPQ